MTRRGKGQQGDFDMTLEEIDNKLHWLQQYYKSYLELCCTVEIPLEVQREVEAEYFGERHKLILERGASLAQNTHDHG